MSNSIKLFKNPDVLFIRTFAARHERSVITLPLGENKTKTAAHTRSTAFGGDPNDFNSVKLFLFKVLRASWAAIKAGSAFLRSDSHNFAFTDTSASIMRTLASSSATVIIHSIQIN